MKKEIVWTGYNFWDLKDMIPKAIILFHIGRHSDSYIQTTYKKIFLELGDVIEEDEEGKVTIYDDKKENVKYAC